MKRRAISAAENSLFSSSGEEQEADGCARDLFQQVVVEEEEEQEATGGGTSKKRRLSPDQVRTLEKHFEEENKLEPERKARLADELGLQPRQVAVWFQNRRARWKTKQLERDFAALKASHDALRRDFDSLHRHNQSLLCQIKKLQEKIQIKEETVAKSSEILRKNVDESEQPPPAAAGSKADGVSDSDSSAVVTEATAEVNEDMRQLGSASDKLSLEVAAGEISCPDLMNLMDSRTGFSDQSHGEMLKMKEEGEDEDDFIGESCFDFFADEKAAAMLSWYYSGERWN